MTAHRMFAAVTDNKRQVKLVNTLFKALNLAENFLGKIRD